MTDFNSLVSSIRPGPVASTRAAVCRPSVYREFRHRLRQSILFITFIFLAVGEHERIANVFRIMVASLENVVTMAPPLQQSVEFIEPASQGIHNPTIHYPHALIGIFIQGAREQRDILAGFETLDRAWRKASPGLPSRSGSSIPPLAIPPCGALSFRGLIVVRLSFARISSSCCPSWATYATWFLKRSTTKRGADSGYWPSAAIQPNRRRPVSRNARAATYHQLAR